MKKIVFLLAMVVTAISAMSQNQAPVAENDTVEVVSQTYIEIDVLSNDHDPDGDMFSIRSINNPRHGVADTIGGKISYKSGYFTGKDSLKYRIQDSFNNLSDYAWIMITVVENPDLPVAVEDNYNLIELEPAVLNVLENDYDPNNDELKIRNISGQNNCEARISEDSASVLVVPDLNASSGFFQYRNEERNTTGHFYSDVVLVRFSVSNNPDIPVPVEDMAQTTGGIAVDIPVLVNDSDSQGESFEIKDFTQPSSGTVTRNGDILIYLPAISYKGIDSFKYCIREINDTTIYSDYVKVTVEVAKNPDCPVGNPDNASGMTYIPMTIEVLSNDEDQNGDPFELMDVTTNSNATVSISGDLINYQSASLTMGSDVIYYRIRQIDDPLYYSEWTPVYIELAVNPELPVAVTDYVSTRSGMPVTIRPLDNDLSNVEDTMHMLAISGAKKGLIRDKTDSSFMYYPFFNAAGVDSLHYINMANGNYGLMTKGNIVININDKHFYDSLNINNINAGVNANGMLFTKIFELPGEGNSGGMDPHFRFPAGGMKNTVFVSSLWIGGVDESDSLHLCAERYKQMGVDLQAGPVADNYDTSHYLKYGRTWKISAAEVDYHRAHFSDSGYEPPEAIGSWPGNGNPVNGEAMQLAPYEDVNRDGVYDPLDGDYPLIRGDQTVFIIFNDDLQHTESSGNRLRIEVQAMVYAFNDPTDSALCNTVFVHYDLINRSASIYTGTYTGIFTDLDIGYAWDDFIGCEVNRGSFYGYNGAPVDGNGEPEAYGENPPAQSVTVLAGPFMDPDGLDNPAGNCDESINGLNFGNGISDDERYGMTRFIYFNNTSSNPATTDPQLAPQYYDYLNGKWKDSTNMVYGGSAHFSDTSAVGPECDFMFPGSSDPLNWGTGCAFPNGGYNQNGKYWTEEESGNNSGDRRGLCVMGPFTFEPGEVQEIELSFCAANGWGGPLSSINQLFANIDSLRQAVKRGEIIISNSELGIKDNVSDPAVLSILPNPASSCINIELPVNQAGLADYEIYNLTGGLCLKGTDQPVQGLNINIRQLVPGFYMIMVKTGNHLFSGKFVKI